MTDISPERVLVLAEAFKHGWHTADDANLPDRTHHGIRAVLEHPELADLIAVKIHEALERAAEAVRMSAWPPRYIMGADALAEHTHVGMMWLNPEPATKPRRLCDLPPEDQDSADAAADELQRLYSIGQTRRDLISDDDWAWFCAHPLAGHTPGISKLAPAIIEWLRGNTDTEETS